MREILALAGKDLRLLLRDKPGFFFVFFFPLIYAVFFGVIFSGGGGSRSISIALVDEDRTERSAAFVKKLLNSDGLRADTTDRAAATGLVRLGKRAAYVVLPEGFGQSSSNLFAGEPTRLEIGVDPARKAESAMLKGVITQYFMEGLQDAFGDPDMMQGQIRTGLDRLRADTTHTGESYESLERFLVQMDTAMNSWRQAESGSTAIADSGGGWQPLSIEVSDVAVKREGPKNAFEITFPQAIIWGLIGCAAAFGISLVTERTRGTLVRLRIAPLTRWQILAGKGSACFVAILSVAALMFAVSVTVFGVQPDSLTYLVMAIASAGLCFVGIMMLLSVLGKTEASAGGIGWAVLLVMAMTGGGMIPLFVMPSWMQTVSTISPVRWAVLAMEGAVWRGFTFETMLLHCGMLVGIGAACFLVGAKIFRWTAPE
jgi:ABC-2 type transport system permease protein